MTWDTVSQIKLEKNIQVLTTCFNIFVQERFVYSTSKNTNFEFTTTTVSM